MSEHLRRRVEAQRWARSGWLPEFKVIEWPALEAHRERHEAALEAFGKAKGDKATAVAIRSLCDAVVAAVSDLRARIGQTYGTGSHVDLVNEFEQVYGALRAEVEVACGGRAPTGRDDIEAWAERTAAAPELVEAALRREDLAEDVQRWVGFQALELLGPTRLLFGAILPVAASEAAGARRRAGGHNPAGDGDKTHAAQSGRRPRRTVVEPLSGLAAVAKRPEVLDVEANLWL